MQGERFPTYLDLREAYEDKKSEPGLYTTRNIDAELTPKVAMATIRAYWALNGDYAGNIQCGEGIGRPPFIADGHDAIARLRRRARKEISEDRYQDLKWQLIQEIREHDGNMMDRDLAVLRAELKAQLDEEDISNNVVQSLINESIQTFKALQGIVMITQRACRELNDHRIASHHPEGVNALRAREIIRSTQGMLVSIFDHIVSEKLVIPHDYQPSEQITSYLRSWLNQLGFNLLLRLESH